MAAAMPSLQGGSGHGMLPDVDGEVEDKFLAEFAREFMQRGASLELPASLNEFGTFPSPGIDLPQQDLASSIASDYPQFCGGAAVPSRDAEFEAWHGPLGVVPQQQQQQLQQQQQQQQPFPTMSNPVQAPPRAGALGMPALPYPGGSQSFPQYLQQYDAGFRGSDPLSAAQPSFASSAQTSVGVGPSQHGFASQSMPVIGNGSLAPASVDHAMPQSTLGFGFDASSVAAMPRVVSPTAMVPEASTSNSDEAQPLGLQRNSTGGSGGSVGGASGGRLLRKTNSGGSAASAERDHVLNGAIKKDNENGADKMARQLSKFKEKNRTAQKRYRERQKSKLQDSEEKVAELTEQLNALKVEKETLANRNALLEKFLAMQQQQQQAGSTSIVEGEKEAWWLDDRTKRLIEQTMRLNGTLTFTVRPGTPLQLTREQIAELPLEEYEALWSEYVNAYAECLLKANNDASSPAGKRLAQLVYEAGQIKGSIAMTHPDRIHSAKAGEKGRTLCMGSTADSKNVAHLLEMIGSIHLGDEQKKIVLSLRKLYLQNLGILVRRRQDLSSMLQGGYPLGDKAAMVADVYLRTVATMDKLRETLRDEHSFLIQFMLTVWRRVLTPFQVAQLAVQTYPGNADILAMINALAEDMGEPPAAEVVRQGGELKDTALVPIDTAAAMLPSSFNGHPVYQPPDVDSQKATAPQVPPQMAPQSVRSGAGPAETGVPPQPSPQWVPL